METGNTSFLMDSLHEFRDCRGKFNSEEYEEAVTKICDFLQPHTQRILESEENDGDMAVAEVVSEFRSTLSQELDSMKKREKSLQTEEYRIVLAMFIIPALQKLMGESGLKLAEKIKAVWDAMNPETPFAISSFEKLSGGFQKKLMKGCFITTAVCQAENKSDDCEELTAFRAFRDGWLSRQPDGEQLIEEYYSIAPRIVERIDSEPDSVEIYGRIRAEYLEQCFEDLKQGRFPECRARYVAMVNHLKKEFLPQ